MEIFLDILTYDHQVLGLQHLNQKEQVQFTPEQETMKTSEHCFSENSLPDSLS